MFKAHVKPQCSSLKCVPAVTHVSDDLHQAVCGAARVTDALDGGQQVRGRVTQQHTHLVSLTAGKHEQWEN